MIVQGRAEAEWGKPANVCKEIVTFIPRGFSPDPHNRLRDEHRHREEVNI